MQSKLRQILIILTVIISVSFIVLTFAKPEFFSLFKKSEKTKSNDEIAAVVNGEKITEKHIDFIVEYKTLSNKNAEQYEKENGLEIKPRTVDRKEILNEEIKKIVIWQETKKQNLIVDFEDAYKQAKEIYEGSKSDKYVTEELEAYMKANNLSETEYIELYAKSYQKQLSEQKLYEKITENIDGSKQEYYQEYVDNLVKESDIQIK